HPVYRPTSAGGGVSGVAVGLAATAVLAVPAIAVAQDDSAPETTTLEGSAETGPTKRGGHLEDALAPLVEDGVLTQQQADAVVEQLQEVREENGHDGPRGKRFGPAGNRADLLDETVTDLLQITSEELIAQLREGASLAEVAEANGVDPQTLIDEMVDAAQERIDESVAAGEISESEATERSAKVSEHITARVNGEIGDRPHGRFGPRGHFGPPNAPSADSTEEGGA
ncbi:MAG: hypothetical protein IH940_12945, partial [Acidobacteria bacterium]|nr:hypothetical protein [Acidobacteriota bacterium]